MKTDPRNWGLVNFTKKQQRSDANTLTYNSSQLLIARAML